MIRYIVILAIKQWTIILSLHTLYCLWIDRKILGLKVTDMFFILVSIVVFNLLVFSIH